MRDYSNEKVLDRLGMYERRIESSLYRTMKELQNRRLLRKSGPADGRTGEKNPAQREGMADSAKQTQFPAVDGVHGTPYNAGDRLCKTNPIPQAADTLTGGDCFAALARTETGEGPSIESGSRGANDPACETKPIPGTAAMQESTTGPLPAGTA